MEEAMFDLDLDLDLERERERERESVAFVELALRPGAFERFSAAGGDR